MRRSAGKTVRSRAGAIAMLLPVLALAACSGQEDVMAEKVAAAEAAANKAVAAQQAAEKAAAAIAAAQPAPRPEPTVMADTPNPFADDSDNDNTSDNDSDPVIGGEGATMTADGVVVPGRGA